MKILTHTLDCTANPFEDDPLKCECAGDFQEYATLYDALLAGWSFECVQCKILVDENCDGTTGAEDCALIYLSGEPRVLEPTAKLKANGEIDLVFCCPDCETAYDLGAAYDKLVSTATSPVQEPDKRPDIHIHPFVRRQTPESHLSHWVWSDENLLTIVREGFPHAKQGYRDGVLEVPVDPSGFRTTIVKLEKGDVLTGSYMPRVEGEEPRKTLTFKGRKQLAGSCIVILYRKDVLDEDNDDKHEGHEWSIISVNAFPTDEEVPIMPDTLIANHFHLSGGTKTNMTDAEFVAALHKSVLYWKDKAMVQPYEVR